MTDLRQASTILRYYASIPIAVLCLIALSLFVVIGFKSILGPILGATAGGLVALFVLHIRPLEVDLSTDIENSLPDYRIATIVTCLYITTLVIAYLDVIHKRPIIHYMLFGGFAAYVAYEIALGARHRRVLPQLFALTFFTYWSVQFAFPLGMFNADARGSYLPEIRTALDTGAIETTYGTLGHMVYALETILITGLSPRIGYFLLGVLILTSTLFLIGIIDRILPAISKQTALYAALFFGCSAWTLGRGFRPSKLAFFYGLTLLIGLVVIVQYIGSSREQKRWMLIGVIATPAIIYGHRFSAGAAMVFIVVLAVFLLIASEWSLSTYERVSVGSLLAFSAAYTISVIGTPVHQEPLLQRLSGLLISVVAPTSSAPGGGPGRYSEVAMELLLVSTAGEAILFGLGVLGVTIAIRRGNWEHDIVVFWMAALSLLLIISLLFNAADVPAQRLYALLALFGLNIFAGTALVWFLQSETQVVSPHTVGAIIFVFAILSLASPVASIHLSVIGDDVPHLRLYETSQLNAGDKWVEQYQGNESTMLNTEPPNTELPYEQTNALTATVDVADIQSGYRYVYTQSVAETGIRTGGGIELGSREYLFLDFKTNHSKIYSNAVTTAYFAD